MPKNAPATPGAAGSTGGAHVRRSLGLQKSSAPAVGGGVITTSKTTNTQAAQPKGSGQGKVTPTAAKAPPVRSAKVIGQAGRTVAGTGRKIKSS